MPVSRMWALKVTRSTMAATRRGSGEHRAPFAEGQVGRDRDRGPFFAFGDDLEQQFGAACRPRLAGCRGEDHAGLSTQQPVTLVGKCSEQIRTVLA